MKIYLGGSIHGGRDFEENLNVLSTVLEGLGHEVLSKPFVVEKENGFLSEAEIFLRDTQKIFESDLVILEVSQASHGVGAEQMFALMIGKTVLCLRDESLQERDMTGRSAFLEGPKARFANLHFRYYKKETVKKDLADFIWFEFDTKEGRVVRIERHG